MKPILTFMGILLTVNILGQLVHKEFLNKHTLTKEFNLSHFEKGIYTVSLNLEEKTAQTQKIIIK
jgi:hypothetical protein